MGNLSTLINSSTFGFKMKVISTSRNRPVQTVPVLYDGNEANVTIRMAILTEEDMVFAENINSQGGIVLQSLVTCTTVKV